MQRRRISIGGRSISVTHQRHLEIKELMREKFKDSKYINDFIEVLMRSGWDMLDIDSTMRQHSNHDRPAVQALLFNNEHVLDQIRLNQATYTHFWDTAADPNYALRHPAQTELILRRLTPGDLIMLSAAQHVSAHLGESDRPAQELGDYWQLVWRQILATMPQVANEIAANRFMYEPIASVSAALDFVKLTKEQFSNDTVTLADLRHTFMIPGKPFYVGVEASRTSVRVGDSFTDAWEFTRIDDRWESCWMAACVLFCYAIDNEARSIMSGDKTMPRNAGFHSKFFRLLTDKKLSSFHEVSHGDQETQNDTGPVSSSRLLP